MGGNALKNTETVRVNTETLNRVTKELQKFFNENFPMLRIEPVKSYTSKETHGDLDLLYSVKAEFSKVTTAHFTHFIDAFLRLLDD